MIALFTFRPSFCANCGRAFKYSRYAEGDYAAWASFECPDCLLAYQGVTEEAALDAAEASGGDLKRVQRTAG